MQSEVTKDKNIPGYKIRRKSQVNYRLQMQPNLRQKALHRPGAPSYHSAVKHRERKPGRPQGAGKNAPLKKGCDSLFTSLRDHARKREAGNEDCE